MGGERIKYPCPYRKGNKYSVIVAVSVTGVEAAVYGEWATDGEIFLEFVNKQLVPRLDKDKVVIMDNVSFHKVIGVKEAIEATGAQLVFLPPYSPDLSPIENMWSKIKYVIKKFAPRTRSQFRKVIRNAFRAVEQQDLISWFRHCGYTLSIN